LPKDADALASECVLYPLEAFFRISSRLFSNLPKHKKGRREPMKYATKSISRTLIFSLFMLINPLLLFAQPNVPGFIVETYAQQSDLRPTQLSFDSTGVLYVGNNGAYVPIWQIGVGGSPINAYGDPIFDPDAVVIDETGDVASIAGSVLVGSGGGGGNLATIYEILPDETTNILFQAGNLSNPQDMIIDDTGRLLIADAFRGAVLQSTGSAPTVLFSQTLPNEVAVDTSGRIFTGSPSGIQIHDSNGNLIDGSFVTGIDIWGLDFGPSSPPWDGHLFAISFQGKLYRIDEIGTVTEIGKGFNNPLDLKFGPDGAMYVSDFGNNVIYRIVAKALIKINCKKRKTTMNDFFLKGICLFMIR
jgi:hypothetical protein